MNARSGHRSERLARHCNSAAIGLGALLGGPQSADHAHAAKLYEFTPILGVVADVGDWNGDGVSEVAISDPSFSESAEVCGVVVVVSGSDGRVLHVLSGTREFERFGASVIPIGDLNHDGHADLLVSSFGGKTKRWEPPKRGEGPETLLASFDGIGRVAAISGADGSRLYQIACDEPDTDKEFGAALEDLDGDGVPDFAVGIPSWRGHALDGSHKGSVSIRSGVDGHELRRIQSVGPMSFGSALACLSIDDAANSCLAIGAPIPSEALGEVDIVRCRDSSLVHRIGIEGADDRKLGGTSLAVSDAKSPRLFLSSLHQSVHAIDARTWKELWSAKAPRAGAADSGFGDTIAIVEDADGDGVRDLIVGSYTESQQIEHTRLVFVSGASGTSHEFTPQQPSVDGQTRVCGIADSTKSPKSRYAVLNPLDGHCVLAQLQDSKTIRTATVAELAKR